MSCTAASRSCIKMGECELNGLSPFSDYNQSKNALKRVLHLLLAKCEKIKYTKGTFCILYSLYCHNDSEYMAGTC